MTLRERQKTNRRAAMLDTARTLFRERTYAKTTMEAIAEDAEVGVATLYNYFGTKEGMLAEIARDDFEWIRSQCALVVDDPPDDPVHAMQLLFKPYQEARKLATVEMISTYLTGAKRGEGPFRDIARWADRWMKAQVKAVLDEAKESGRLAEDLNTNEAADIILALFNKFYYQGFRSDQKVATRAFKKFIKLFPLVFKNWHGSAQPD